MLTVALWDAVSFSHFNFLLPTQIVFDLLRKCFVIEVCVVCALIKTVNYFNYDNNLCVNRRNSQPIGCYAPPNRSMPDRSDLIDLPPLLLLRCLSICFVVRLFRRFFFFWGSTIRRFLAGPTVLILLLTK